jgi:hypothetical protein
MKRMNFPDRRAKRKAEALERQKAYDRLPDNEKIKRNPAKKLTRKDQYS